MRDKGYDFIRFFAMTLIVIYHLYCRAKYLFLYNVPQILDSIIHRPSLHFGGIGVALFFMLSGALLISKYKENFSYKSFYLKRFIRIEIPQIISFWILFWIICLFFNRSLLYNNPLGTLISSFGLNYCGIPWDYFNINVLFVVGEWFTAVIILLYLLFPLLRTLFIKHHIIGTILISTIYLVNLKLNFLSGNNGWFSITNGLMCFWIGMLFEKYKKYLCNSVFILISFIAVFLFIIYNPSNFLGYPYLPCFIFSIFLFIVLYQIKISTILTRYVCKYNYEIYLVHHRIFLLLFPLLLMQNNNYFELFITCINLLLITCLSAQILKYLSNKVIDYLTLKIK